MLQIIAHAKRRWVSAASYLEFVMVTKDQTWIDGFIRASQIEVLDVSKRDIGEAVQGYFRFGKGIHPASMNFGDCVVYGTARANSIHLLCKGNDFTQTDVGLVEKLGEETV